MFEANVTGFYTFYPQQWARTGPVQRTVKRNVTVFRQCLTSKCGVYAEELSEMFTAVCLFRAGSVERSRRSRGKSAARGLPGTVCRVKTRDVVKT